MGSWRINISDLAFLPTTPAPGDVQSDDGQPVIKERAGNVINLPVITE